MALFSVLSNDAAKVLLSSVQKYDVFIVGHAAPEQSRREMVDWLKERYPEVKTLALNPPHQPLPNAGHNALHDDPESWLQFVIERVAWPPPVAGKVRYPAM